MPWTATSLVVLTSRSTDAISYERPSKNRVLISIAAAKERLVTVDLLGFQDDFDTFLAELETRWNWRIEPVERVNSAEERPLISDAFRQRIIDDNPYDMAFYEFARSNR